MKIINRDFYKRDTVTVAKDLLGKILVRSLGNDILSGIIVETEAYSDNDPASHSYKGETERNFPMFGTEGFSYVYLTYGNHFCMNIVAKDKSQFSGAVLVRAIEPQSGTFFMYKNRNSNDFYNLTSGPGKLTSALKISRELNNLDLTQDGPLYLIDNINSTKIIETTRIGIKVAVDKKWRFCLKGNKFLSKKPF